MANTFATTGGTAHSTTVTGLTNGSSYNVFVRCQDPATNANTNDFTIAFSVAQPADTTPPVRSNGSPSGTLAAGTTQTTLSLTTNESATCRYAASPGVAYGSMPNTFATTGGTAHSTTVNGLTNGSSYSFFVRCQDPASNANTNDFSITFSVAQPADTTPPVRSNGSPSGMLAAGTTQTALGLTTNENATCRYSTTPGVAYGSMTSTFTTTGALAHSTPVSGLSNGSSYSFFVRCQDYSSNPDPDDFSISFSVAQPTDTTPPVRSQRRAHGHAGRRHRPGLAEPCHQRERDVPLRHRRRRGVRRDAQHVLHHRWDGALHHGRRPRQRRQLQLLRPLSGRRRQRQYQRLHDCLLGGPGHDRRPGGRLRLQRGEREQYGRCHRQRAYRHASIGDGGPRAAGLAAPSRSTGREAGSPSRTPRRWGT